VVSGFATVAYFCVVRTIAGDRASAWVLRVASLYAPFIFGTLILTRNEIISGGFLWDVNGKKR
jgi:hypothetical protein